MHRAGSQGSLSGVREGHGRVRRTSPKVDSKARADKDDFACAYEVAIRPDDNRSSEQWARAAWEAAPAPLRWFMLGGWRLILGLRLGPRHSQDHILGWTIVDRSPDETVCQLRSRFLEARNTFQKADGKLIWSTFVTYERPIARGIWSPVSLLHRLVVRVSLRRAAHP